MLNRIITEIKTCLENECYIAALSLALTIPDICGKAEYPTDNNTARYIKWYNNYIGNYDKPLSQITQDMPYLNGELVYNLRNSILHQGNPNIEKKKIKEERCKVDHFIIIISEYNGIESSSIAYGKKMAITERSIDVNIANLCYKLCETGEQYYNANSQKFTFFDYEIEDRRNNTLEVF